MSTSDKIDFDRQGSVSVWQFVDDGDYWKIRKEHLPAYKEWVEQELRERLAKEVEEMKRPAISPNGSNGHSDYVLEEERNFTLDLVLSLLRKDI